MKVFISQPMTDRSKEEILMERQAITNILKGTYGEDTEIIFKQEYSVITTGQSLNNGANQMVDNLPNEEWKSCYKETPIPAESKPVRKTIIVINGKGGVGKDTLCRIAGEYFRTQNVSAIDPIKEMARKHLHWDNDKSDKGRKLLSDLKAISIQYDDTPNSYLVSKAYDFMEPDDNSQILFVHIREPEEIDKFIHSISLRATCPVKTVLVRSDKLGKEHYGNASDDNVENYEYDYCFNNNGTLEEAEQAFIKFLLKEVGV